MAVTELIDKISRAFDRKEIPIGIFLDLSKAFDTVNHSILLDKLYHYGIRGITLNWFRSYLTGRKQFVYIDSCLSLSKQITCGVPQGSILGPLLFLIYINDIESSSNILSFILFADDTSIIYSHPNILTAVTVINTELDKVSNWLKS